MSALSGAAVAVLLGGLLAVGLLLVLAAFPRWRWANLSTRIAPHVRDVTDLTDPAERLPWRMPAGGSWAVRLKYILALFGGGDTGVALRMTQAGLPGGPGRFRSRQLVWVLVGLGAGAAATVVLVLAGRMSVPVALLPVLAAITGGVLCEMLLGARAKARIGRITEELPTVLEFLALCLSAGEALPDALRRVGQAGSGELSGELRGVILAVNTGSSLADALGDCAQRLQIPSVNRATDQIVAALERGAPLAAVLQAQATDAREETKRALIEQAGRKEILMLLPNTIAKTYLSRRAIAVRPWMSVVPPKLSTAARQCRLEISAPLGYPHIRAQHRRTSDSFGLQGRWPVRWHRRLGARTAAGTRQRGRN